MDVTALRPKEIAPFTELSGRFGIWQVVEFTINNF